MFQVISERAELATPVIATNPPFSEWTMVFPNARLCKALLDRITDRATIIETGSDSYRSKRTIAGKKKARQSALAFTATAVQRLRSLTRRLWRSGHPSSLRLDDKQEERVLAATELEKGKKGPLALAPERRAV